MSRINKTGTSGNVRSHSQPLTLRVSAKPLRKHLDDAHDIEAED